MMMNPDMMQLPPNRAARRQRGMVITAAVLIASILGGCSSLPLWMVAQHRSMITDHQHFTNAPLKAAGSPSPLPVAVQPLAMPPAPTGEPLETWAARRGTVALVVLRDGQVVYEQYFNGRQRDTLLTSFSVAKSVVALLLGQAIRDGHIASVNDPVTRYLPELARQDARFAQIRLRDLLAMRSGIAFQEDYTAPWSDVAVFYLTPDLASAVAGLRIAEPPDQRYQYRSGNTQLLAMAIERASGQPLARLASEGLWQPMGAEMDASWSLDSAEHGHAKGFCCLNARAIDFARLGQLVLNRGRVGERQVVPADWIDELLRVRTYGGDNDATRRNIESAGRPQAVFYTGQWRRMPAGPVQAVPVSTRSGEQIQPGQDFYAQGQHGQFIYVAPQQRTVVVRLGTDLSPDVWWPGLLGVIARAGTDSHSVAALSTP